MKKLMTLLLTAVLMLSLCACGGNYGSVDLQDTLPIPEDGMVEDKVISQIKSENAIGVFAGTSGEFSYEWTIFGSDITEVREVNLLTTIEKNSKGEIEISLAQEESFGFSALLSVYLNDVWDAQSATAYEGEKALYSTADGLIGEISLGENPYLRLYSLQALALECEISQTQRKLFSRSDLALQDENGIPLELLELGEICTANGSIRLLLRYELPGLTYGQQLSSLTLYTGRVYSQTLAVEKRCVYQKNGDDASYLRLVDEAGHFLGEAEVLTGYANEDYICVSGVEEGTLCDGGYGAVWEGNHGSP